MVAVSARLDSVNTTRLSKSLKHHFEQLAWARQGHARLVKDYAGTHYGRATDPKRRDLVNLMLQTAEAYTMAVAANCPRFIGETDDPEKFGFAQHFGRSVTNLCLAISFVDTLEMLVRDGFFGPAVAKTYLASAGDVQFERDIRMDPGSPYVERLSMDNLVWDTCAGDWRVTSFVGDRYRLCMYDLKDANRFDQSVAKHVKPNSKYEDNGLLAGNIANMDEDDDEIEPQVDLADVYLRKDKLVQTFAVTRDFSIKGSKPLAEFEWDGPEEGPYDLLNLGPVPDNIVPTSPAANLRNLHRLVNSLFRKQANQADRQKDVGVYEGDAAQDAKRIKSAEDGEWHQVNRRDAIGIIKQGGADPATLAFLLQMIGVSDRMAGNLQAAAGLGPQSGTAAQDAMINAKVSAREQAIANKVMRFVSKLGSNLGNLLFSDPAKVVPGHVDIGLPGYPKLRSDWEPGKREGSYQDYRIVCVPESGAFKTSQQRLAAIEQTIAPFLQNPALLQQAGVQLDLQEYLALKADLLNEPRLRRIFKFDYTMRDQEMNQGPGGGETTRNYVRKNVAAGPSQEANRNLLTQSLLGGGSAAINSQQAGAMMSVPQ